MSTAFVLAVPSKGRLQENAEAFFARAGLTLAKPRGVRDYRGTIAEIDNVEIAYLSASEIASQLARGMVHLGVTGEDLIRESIVDADKRVALIDGLGFGSANVVVAVPQSWIDVRTMADLDDVTTGFRAQHNRRMRVAIDLTTLSAAAVRGRSVAERSDRAAEPRPLGSPRSWRINGSSRGRMVILAASLPAEHGFSHEQARLLARRSGS